MLLAKLLKTLVDMHIWNLMTLVVISIIFADDTIGHHDLRRFNLNLVQQAFNIKDDRLTDQVDKSYRALEALANTSMITDTSSPQTTAGN